VSGYSQNLGHHSSFLVHKKWLIRDQHHPSTMMILNSENKTGRPIEAAWPKWVLKSGWDTLVPSVYRQSNLISTLFGNVRIPMIG